MPALNKTNGYVIEKITGNLMPRRVVLDANGPKEGHDPKVLADVQEFFKVAQQIVDVTLDLPSNDEFQRTRGYGWDDVQAIGEALETLGA